jgi:hypothetical protein
MMEDVSVTGTELGTQYTNEDKPVIVTIARPIKRTDGTFRANVSIGNLLANAPIAGDTPLDCHWHATQFAMTHLHMLFSDGKISFDGETRKSLEEWHRNRPPQR